MTVTYQTILETHANIFKDEHTLYGQLIVGPAKFRQAHNILDNRVKGINDKLIKLQAEYFVISDGKIEFDPPKEEGGEPTLRLLEGKLLEEYRKAEEELLKTEITI